MPPDLALLSTLTDSNYPCLELIFMVPKVFEPLKSSTHNVQLDHFECVAWDTSLIHFYITNKGVNL